MGGLAGGSGCQLQVTTMVRKEISLSGQERARRRVTIRAIYAMRILPFATH